ncbi:MULTISPECIES: lipocalin family protein [Microbacterium]|uniref:lipocalin family protein n=1 Tax=Microbacterium TaxID=33882 RepID=UPI00217E14B9|nr:MULTISPECIES: lipocalin family protein [Microbacterium]UWF78412.1 lipocalin family protein [Microbacterium neungamense]WCM56587.1 lipocalin family protein [Microbacterium sp. EF45047]
MSDVRSVPALELDRYLGLWYEIGRLPLRFEDDDARDVTAEYSLNPDGTVRVDNRCLNKDGEPTQAIGEALRDADHPGRLRVSFLPEALRWIPFTRADYWVLRVDEDYRHALVGTPDRKHLWLLAREPRIDTDVVASFLATAEEQGFDLAKWIEPEQSGRVVEV